MEAPYVEAQFLRVGLEDNSELLLCGMYCPPRQGPSQLDFLKEKLDTLLSCHKCRHAVIVGSLNHHLDRNAFKNLLLQDLQSHVTYPPHERGESLDLALTDLPETSITCQQLETVVYSDHHAVLTQVTLTLSRKKGCTQFIMPVSEGRLDIHTARHRGHGLEDCINRGRRRQSPSPHYTAPYFAFPL